MRSFLMVSSEGTRPRTEAASNLSGSSLRCFAEKAAWPARRELLAALLAEGDALLMGEWKRHSVGILRDTQQSSSVLIRLGSRSVCFVC